MHSPQCVLVHALLVAGAVFVNDFLVTSSNIANNLLMLNILTAIIYIVIITQNPQNCPIPTSLRKSFFQPNR